MAHPQSNEASAKSSTPNKEPGSRRVSDEPDFVASIPERKSGRDQRRQVTASAPGGDHDEPPHRRIISLPSPNPGGAKVRKVSTMPRHAAR